MKFLVFSDSHGSSARMRQILQMHRSDLSGVLHLGDGVEEFRMLSAETGNERLIFADVCGNLEQYSMPAAMRPPTCRVLEAEGIKILLVHGHLQNVYFGTQVLSAEARRRGCSVALHGHTHIPAHCIDRGEDGTEQDVEILCPGSIARPRAGGPTFGILEIRNRQVMAYPTSI